MKDQGFTRETIKASPPEQVSVFWCNFSSVPLVKPTLGVLSGLPGSDIFPFKGISMHS